MGIFNTINIKGTIGNDEYNDYGIRFLFFIAVISIGKRKYDVDKNKCYEINSKFIGVEFTIYHFSLKMEIEKKGNIVRAKIRRTNHV